MSPIELMSRVYEISNQFMMKVEFLNEIYVFAIKQQHAPDCDTRKTVNEKLRNRVFHKSVIEAVNNVQNMAMLKLEVFYSLAFNYSQISVQ